MAALRSQTGPTATQTWAKAANGWWRGFQMMAPFDCAWGAFSGACGVSWP